MIVCQPYHYFGAHLPYYVENISGWLTFPSILGQYDSIYKFKNIIEKYQNSRVKLKKVTI